MHRSCFRRFACLFLGFVGVFVARPLEVGAKPLAEVIQAEMGAANWIPEDAGFFVAKYRSGERWQAFTQTNAYQELLTMPAVQMGLAWVQQQPYLGQLAMARAQNRLLDEGLELLQDAWSQEVFFYMDERGPGFINEFGGLYNSIVLNGFLAGINESSGVLPAYTDEQIKERMFRQMLAGQDNLRFPGVVLGFRLSDPQAGRDWLASLTPILQHGFPLPVQEESLGNGEFLTLTLNAAMFLSPQVQAEIEADFGLADLDADLAEKVMEFVKSQTLTISLGLRDDFLLISFGADNTHLKNFGSGISLAESDALAPLRRHFQSRVIGLSYLHPDLTNSGKMDVEENIANLQDLLQQAEGNLPAGLAERVTADATELLNEINEALPVAQPIVAASFWKEGVESISFSALLPGSMDSSEPLTILSHAGESPLLALAAQSPASLPQYHRLVYWMQKFYGYFVDYGVPEIPAENLEDYKQFESLALPALQKFHETTRDFLIPSLDGGQSLFVMDAKGALTNSPDTMEPLAQPVRFPRPAIVLEVADRQKLITAWQQYRQIINKLLLDVAESDPDVTKMQIPSPETRRLGDATLFTYTIPEEYNPAPYFGHDFEPHVLLTEKHVVFSLSTKQSQQLLASHSLPTSSLVDLQKPAGRAAWFDCLEMKELVCDDANAILALVEEEKGLDPNLSIMIKIHVDKLRKVLGALKNYRSRTYEEDGLRVKHSWFRIEDIEP